MLNIKVIASGSKGNGYILDDGRTVLLLEAGVKLSKIQEHEADFSKFAACFITHEHKDHAEHAEKIAKRGIPVYATPGTLKAVGASHNLMKPIAYNEVVRVGSWRIMAFDVQHDAAQPCGYLLQSDEGYKVLFVTDTYYIKYLIPGLTHIMVECNYSREYIDDLPEYRKRRLLSSHFEFNHVRHYLSKTDLSKVESIYLLHLSDTNANAPYFVDVISNETGKPVYALGHNI